MPAEVLRSVNGSRLCAESQDLMCPHEFAVPLERSAPQRLRSHPDAPLSSSWRRWARALKKPRAIDLFAGCGGLSLGLEQAGFAVVLSVDNDPWAIETHRHNIPGVTLDLDLSDPDRIDRLVRFVGDVPIDLVAGGPPCQPFSRAGRSKLRSLVEEGVRAAEDTRTGLWRSFLEVVHRLRPRAFLMENVPDMALGDELTVIRRLTERLEAAGYDVEGRLLDAWRHGVPQHRQRLILVGVRDGRSFEWPREQKPISLRSAISDLPRLGKSNGMQKMKAGRARTVFQRKAREGMKGQRLVWDHVTRPVRDDDREAFRLMKPGTRYGDLPEHLRRYRDDIFNDKYNRLGWEGLCRSITAHIAKDGYWYIHPGEHRTLTVREAARVQTFPDRFRFSGTRSHAFRQIGNAVPPALGEAVGRELMKALGRKPLPKSRRRSEQLARMRENLLEWATVDALAAPWRHPGAPWKVLAGVVLADRTGSRDAAVAAFLERFPKPTQGIATKIRKAAAAACGPEAKGLERLGEAARVLARGRDPWASDHWIEAAGLSDAEAALVCTIGLGEDRVLVTAAILRVTARLLGLPVDEERRLSDGRMAVGKLIGGEKSAPAVTAALHALGRVVCTPARPTCARCPLQSFCATRGQIR